VGDFAFPYSWIFLPQYFFVGFFCCESWWGHCRESFSVKFILHSLWYTPLVYVFMNLFFSMWSSVYVPCWFFFSQPDVNITWITGNIHRSVVDKIDPTSEYVEMVIKIYIINYIGLHIFVKCDQKNLFNRKKYFWWSVK
jgi:hypothetical protein